MTSRTSIVFSLLAPLMATAGEVDQLKFFENSIRPLLSAECYECHGREKAKGGLRLDHIDLILEGGDSGPAIIPGQPEESLLVAAIHRNDPDFQMPPKKALTETQIQSIETWIAGGAKWPEETFTAVERDENGFTEADRGWWAIQPLAEVTPPKIGGDWAKNDIDRFVFRRLEENHLKPAPPAEARELVRRIYYDLHGLPPTPEAVMNFIEEFAKDEDAAVVALTNELLASPRYGERWGQHWLDVVRYAESDGYRADDYRPDTWRYRDYVIRSFNEDKPYDQFVREQLAADEFAPNDPETLIGTAFLRLGIYEWNQRNARMQWDLILTEMTNVTGEVFLGLGIGCAQCHDHKFDPILQRDHFALQAFLNSTWWPENQPLATEEELKTYQKKQSEWEAATADIREKVFALQKSKRDGDFNYTVKQFPEDIQKIYRKPKDERSAYEEQLAQLVQRQIESKWRRIDWEKELAKKKDDSLATYQKLSSKLAEFDHLKPTSLPMAFISTDVSPHAAETKLKTRQGEETIEPAFLTLLNEPAPDISPTPTTTGRRSALAEWITSRDNPLSTRVITNRIWQYHFGTGLVPTPNDFGKLGESPSHPELLDWLTEQLIENDWRLKDIHRLIISSATYRQTARREPTTDEDLVDPLNRLLWRFPPRRLDAEQIRDSILAISGELSDKSDGPSVDSSANSRSVFMKKRRNTRDELIGGFDAPLRFASAPSRLETTSPNQSLFLVNSEWSTDRSVAMAQSLIKDTPVNGDTIRKAYEAVYGRGPSEVEIELALCFVNQQSRLLPETQSTPHKYPNETGRRPVEQQFKDLPELANGNHTLWLQPGSRFQQLQLDEIEWPEDTFTIEAVARLDSIHKDASVNTLLSRWNGSHADSGWTFGITSEKSRYQPRNFIMQLVGNDFQNNRIYEVVASNLRFPLAKPVYFATSVQVIPGKDDVTKGEVTFYLKDLSDPESPLQTQTVSHQVVGGLHPKAEVLSLIGGRHTHTHLWDGQLARLLVSKEALKPDQLVIHGGTAPRVFDWNFSGAEDNPPAPNSHWRNPNEKKSNQTSPQLSALTDFCQALFNSNEFLYLH